MKSMSMKMDFVGIAKKMRNEPDPYVDDSLNEVSMGRFDDDPPEW